MITGILLAALLSGDLSGIWTGQIPARNGEMQDIAFKLTQTGTSISGKLYGDYRSSPIVEGKVDGEQVMFVVAGSEQAGNQINRTRLRFTGSLQNGELVLTRERESSVNAGNAGGGAPPRPGDKPSFKLKRLL